MREHPYRLRLICSTPPLTLAAALLLGNPFGGGAAAVQEGGGGPSAGVEQAAASPAEAQAAPDSLPPRTGPTDPGELEAFLDGVMKIQLQEHDAAGAVITVVKDGEIFFSKGYGYADWEARTPVDPATTLFRIGSVTKLFVWTTVMQLVEEGRLDLDADVNTYLTDFRIPDTYPEPVTLRHIMTHSAGFEDWVLKLFAKDSTGLAPLGEILAEQLPARVRPPGEASSYSNHATGIAAYIVEEVSGMPWDAFLRERVTDPLGIEFFSVAQPLPEELASHMSKGYSGSRPYFEEEDFEYVPLYPVGAAAASGEAMARFMIAHLQLGRYGDGRILEEETARRMHSELYRMAPGVNPMAHGFYEMSTHGERIIGHGGDTFWFHSELALFPEHDLGVFLSFNSEGGGAATGQLMDAFVDRYFPAEEVLPTPPEDFGERAERFTGHYRANRFSHTTIAKAGALGSVEVTATDEGTLRAMDAEWIEVAPLTFAEKYGDETLVFREAEDGTITHFFLAGVPIMAFERVPGSENIVLHAVLAVVAGVLMLGTLLAWPLGWILRRWYGLRGEDLRRIPPRARWALRLGALTFALFVLGLLMTVADAEALVMEIPFSLRLILLLPFVGAALAVWALTWAARILVRGEGRGIVRVTYLLTVLSFGTFLWQLQVWNLLGWRF